MVRQNPVQNGETVLIRQIHVEEDETKIVLFRGELHGLVAICGLYDDRVALKLPDQVAQHFPDQALVIDDQDLHGGQIFGLTLRRSRRRHANF